MTSTEWLESRGLPIVCAFAVGVLVTDTVREWQSFERTEALVVARVDSALRGCMPKEQPGARAILAWQGDGRLHCTRLEDFTYGMGAKRTTGAVPVLSLPVARAAIATEPEVTLP